MQKMPKMLKKKKKKASVRNSQWWTKTLPERWHVSSTLLDIWEIWACSSLQAYLSWNSSYKLPMLGTMYNLSFWLQVQLVEQSKIMGVVFQDDRRPLCLYSYYRRIPVDLKRQDSQHLEAEVFSPWSSVKKQPYLPKINYIQLGWNYLNKIRYFIKTLWYSSLHGICT